MRRGDEIKLMWLCLKAGTCVGDKDRDYGCGIGVVRLLGAWRRGYGSYGTLMVEGFIVIAKKLWVRRV